MGSGSCARRGSLRLRLSSKNTERVVSSESVRLPVHVVSQGVTLQVCAFSVHSSELHLILVTLPEQENTCFTHTETVLSLKVYEHVYETVDISSSPEVRANATAKVKGKP